MTHSDIPAADPVSPPAPPAGPVIGLDIGGTKTRGVRFEDGHAVADESVGSSNVQNVSREDAARNLAELFARIGGGKISRVYAGAGGIDTAEDAAARNGIGSVGQEQPGRGGPCRRLGLPAGR